MFLVHLWIIEVRKTPGCLFSVDRVVKGDCPCGFYESQDLKVERYVEGIH